MKTTLKERSFHHDYQDGSTLSVRVSFKGDSIMSHYYKIWESLQEDDLLEVQVVKSIVDSVMDSPIGGIQTLKPAEKKEFEFTFKQYLEFIKKFHEEGEKYFDMI